MLASTYVWSAPRIMLIGQAPGQVELVAREPFAGRAGRILFRWMERVGLDEETFRRHVYMTSVTKCFPGKTRATGGGDRRPSSEEAGLCRPWLERQLALVAPTLILLVGKMAIDLYLPGRSLEELVGRVFERDGAELLPLPHPSGMSRWLNAPDNQERLSQALALLGARLPDAWTLRRELSASSSPTAPQPAFSSRRRPTRPYPPA